MSAHERKVVLSLVGIYLARMLGLFLLFPVLVLFVGQYQFPAYWMAASIIGLYGLSQALMQIPMGWLSDRIGRRATLLVGLALLFAGGVVAAYSDSAWGLFFGRLIQGSGATSAVAMAVVADEISPSNRIKATMIIGISIGASFALAMLLSPMLAGFFSGLRVVFAFSAVLALVAALFVLGLPSRSRAPHQPRPDTPAVAAPQGLAVLCVGVFILHTSLSMIFLSVPEYLARAGIATVHHGWFYFVSLALIGPLLAWRVRRVRASIDVRHTGIPRDASVALTLAWLGLAWYAPVLLAMPESAATLAQLAGLIIVYLYGFTVLETALPAACMALSDSDRRGLTMGVFSSSQFLGSFAGGLIGGLMGQFSAGIVVHLPGIIALLAWMIWAQKTPARQR